jgi:hypothetical protein
MGRPRFFSEVYTVTHAETAANEQRFGFDKVYPAIATIPTRLEHAAGKRSASCGWNYINASLLVAGTCLKTHIVLILENDPWRRAKPMKNACIAALLNWQ